MLKVALFGFFGATLLAFIFYTQISPVFFRQNHPKYRVGILQTASHPALEMVRQTFIDQLKNEFGDQVSFEVRNAEQLFSRASMMAKEFHREKKIDLFFTLGSPATNVFAHYERKKPIIFAAVSDPASLKLVFDRPNITGCFDTVELDQEIQTMQALFPKVSRVAVFYHSKEKYSLSFIEKMKEKLTAKGISICTIPVDSPKEFESAVSSARESADLIFLPADNMIASGIRSIVSFAEAVNIPIFATDHLLVEEGVLAAAGVDYKECGQIAAMMAIQTLQGRVPVSEIPYQLAPPSKTYVYQPGVDQYGLIIPPSLFDNIVFIAKEEEEELMASTQEKKG